VDNPRRSLDNPRTPETIVPGQAPKNQPHAWELPLDVKEDRRELPVNIKNEGIRVSLNSLICLA